MKIEVLGTGCAKCKKLERVANEAVENTGIDATVIKVEDIQEIMKYGVYITPALVIDGKVVMKGKVPSNKELSKLLSQY